MYENDDRKKIPSIDDVPTKYRPLHGLLMVIPLPAIDKIGQIVLPDRSQIILNEGHVVARGPSCTKQIEIGDCITWEKQTETRMSIDNVDFILVNEATVIMKIPSESLKGEDQAEATYPTHEFTEEEKAKIQLG